MEKEYKFATDYAKSSRASCKSCKNIINKDTFRIATMVQSSHFDRKIPIWFHFDCFFKKSTISDLDSIKGIDVLRWEDQEKITNKLSTGCINLVSEDYSLEYAKSNRSKCGQCEEKIEKSVIRFSKVEAESKKAKHFEEKRWYHLDCLELIKGDIMKKTGNFDIEKIKGFNKLNDGDKTVLIKKFKSWKSKKRVFTVSEADASDNKRLKTNDNSIQMTLKKQNELIWKTRDQISKGTTKTMLVQLLEYNKQQVPKGESCLLDSVADRMVFGSLPPCPECNGKLGYMSNRYMCRSMLNEWAKCVYETRDIDRLPFKIPEEYLNSVSIFRSYVCKPKTRILSVEKEKVQSSEPLKGYVLAVDRGPFENQSVTKIKQLVKVMGGELTSKLTENTFAVISPPQNSSTKTKSIIKQAESLSVDVVSVNFLVDLDKEISVPAAVKKHSIVEWGRSIEELTNLRSVDIEISEYNQPKTDIQVFTVKGGAAVDPDSGLSEKAHLFQEQSTGDPLNVVLGMADVVRGSNSFYKLQLLESDKQRKWWVFRAWGRIGTSIGSNKLEKFNNLADARLHFEELYLEKTGNSWDCRKSFKKHPNLFAPIDVDYGQDAVDGFNDDINNNTESKLSLSVQVLIRFIFDMESMKKAMLEFEIDMNRMPLGKLTKKQIDISYGLLKELQELLTGSDSSKMKLMELSNRFYTMMPHNFGLRVPPLIDSLTMVKEKCDMIESLMEMEVAYKLMKSDGSRCGIDSKYDKLQSCIVPLARDSEQFRRVEQYVENTHGPTHTEYRIEVQEIYDVERNGEIDRFKAFRKLSNRMMLWHGSRRTNWAGILSQGLRIAPPEAPVTGYMFGKGLYFADMVTKSSNYCHSTPGDPEGLLLLCEVALGTMTERSKCDERLVLKPGEHSCKGVGNTSPDPAGNFTDADGVLYPMGKPITKTTKSSLLYNEYIVYDIAQVRQRYLLKVNFEFQGRKRR